MASEREITTPVDLCDARGRLNPAARGWARQPMLRANLRRRWGRKKRWDYWAVITDEVVVSFVHADIDYAGLANVWVMEHATGAQAAAGMLQPFARGMSLPAQVCTGLQSVAHKAITLRIEETAEATRLVAAFGVACAPTRRAATSDEAASQAVALGFPLALKAGNGAIVHKSDVGAVRLDLASVDEVRSAFDDLATRLGEEMGGAILQPMVAPGIETIVGILQDRSFGPAVLFGMGGTTAELVRDTAMQLVPVTDADAHDLVRSLRTSPLLFGYRGAAPCDTGALEDLLLRVGLIADSLPEVAELDANPVVVSPTGAVALDVKVRLEPTLLNHDGLRALNPL